MQNSNACKLRVVKVNFRGVEHVAYLVYMTSEELAYLKDFFDKYKSSNEFTMQISKDYSSWNGATIDRAKNGEFGDLKSVIEDLCSVRFSIPETVTKKSNNAEVVLKKLGYEVWKGILAFVQGDTGTFFVRTKNADEVMEVTQILMDCVAQPGFTPQSIHIGKDCIWVYDDVFNYTETVMREYSYINHKKLDEFKESMRLHKIAGFL